MIKDDYPEFPQWFDKKANSGASALVFSDDDALGAFVYLKSEMEEIVLVEQTLAPTLRKKIGTLKLADRYQGQRLGEGALGLSPIIPRAPKSQALKIALRRLRELFAVRVS